MTESETTSSNIFILDTCFINGIPLIVITNTGATCLLVSLDCAEKLGLKLYFMVGSMVIDTSANDSVTTSWVCLNFLLTIYGKSFGMGLVCLPSNKLDVILGMNLLEFNRVHINCFDKPLSFLDFDASDELLMFAKQVDEFMKDEVGVFIILAFMKA